MRLILLVLALVLGSSVAACSIPTEKFIGVPCGAAMCGESATCQDVGSAAVCVCDAGFQDNDNNNSCTPTCDGMACGSKMSCQDSSGTAQCVCNAGFQDNDHDGSCTSSCSLTACATGGTCSDTSGTATCGCAVGYQDKDGDKKCSPSCDLTDCGAFGCDDTTGEAVCVCSLACGTNAVCLVSGGVPACECTGSFVDFDADGNCTSTCGPNLLNGTLTGGSASVVSELATGGYSNRSTIGNTCDGHPDTSGILCDNPPFAGSPRAFEDTYPRAGARFYNFYSSTGTGIVVIDAGSAITFNTLEMFQHFRPNGGIGNSRAIQMRFSVHADTTTAPSGSDAGWVTLNNFDAMPSAQKAGNVITKPGVWFGANQTSRFIRVEVKGDGGTYRTGFRAVKSFLCQ